MLKLTYRSQDDTIEASVPDDPIAWSAFRRVFRESAGDAAASTATSVRVPVWAFLSCREELGYALRKYGVTPELDSEVRKVLEQANERALTYSQVSSGAAIDLETVRSRLSSAGFQRVLKEPFQTRNVAKLAMLPAGATFSVPGAGKTTEALAFYALRRQDDSRLLVVCPKNAFAVWEEQVTMCLPGCPRVSRLVGGEQAIASLLRTDPDILLITYQQLPNVKQLLAEHLRRHPTFMFLDESHRIKRGTGGLWASTILDLSHLPCGKLVMSGTPLPNSASDLVPQLNYLFPEMHASTETVADVIQPIFVRTTKAELGLPPVRRTMVPILMNPCQRHLYELLRSETARQLEALKSRDRSSLRRIGHCVMRLLQMASNPALLAKHEMDFPAEYRRTLCEGDGPKIAYVCRRARELASQGRKVIIWSSFVENVEVIAGRLTDIGADYIHGGVEAGSDLEEDTREAKIKRFHRDAASQVLVANPAACSESISLHTVCHYAIYVDRTYNAAQYLQSEDRIHRLGVDVPTHVDILYAPDTIDESVSERIQAKVARMAEVLNDSSLTVEPVEPDLEAYGLNEDDVESLAKHVLYRPAT